MLTPDAKKIISDSDEEMQMAVNYLEEDLKTYRVGKANPTVMANVIVMYYGVPTPVTQVASVTAPDARTIAIQPWEKKMIPLIEKAIMDANIGLTPQNNGEVIRCNVPPLTEDRRKEVVKKAKAAGEEAKVTVRNSRRDGIEKLKRAQKASLITEDAEAEAEDEMQKVTDKYTKMVDELVGAKEKDIMTV